MAWLPGNLEEAFEPWLRYKCPQGLETSFRASHTGDPAQGCGPFPAEWGEGRR